MANTSPKGHVEASQCLLRARKAVPSKGKKVAGKVARKAAIYPLAPQLCHLADVSESLYHFPL